jgi:hypothetical protein
MSTVPPEKKPPFQYDIITRFALVHGVKSFGVRRRVRVVVFNATFNNMSFISWRSVLLVEENGVHREKHVMAEPTKCARVGTTISSTW